MKRSSQSTTVGDGLSFGTTVVRWETVRLLVSGQLRAFIHAVKEGLLGLELPPGAEQQAHFDPSASIRGAPRPVIPGLASSPASIFLQRDCLPTQVPDSSIARS